MREEKVVVKIKKDGSFEYEVQGIKGESCKDVTKFLDELGEASDFCPTDEFYEEESTNTITLNE